MEVPGRRQDHDLDTGSQDNVSIFCIPCESEGKHIPVHGFCQTCSHYLCAACFKVHKIPLPSRNHVLVAGAARSRSKTSTSKNVPITHPCTIRCRVHHEEVIKCFCSAHNAVVCSVCAVLKHKPCGVTYIPDIAKEYKSSKEYKDLVDDMNRLQTDIKTVSADVKENISSVPRSVDSALEEIRKFRKEINEYCDQKDRELKRVLQKLKQEDSNLLQRLVTEMDCFNTAAFDLMKQLKSKEKALSDLFISSKQLTKEINSLSEKIAKCFKENRKVQYSFKKEKAFVDFFASDAGLGSVERKTQTGSVSLSGRPLGKKTADIDFNSVSIQTKPDIKELVNEDKKKSCITGLVLLSKDRLLLTDFYNNSIKTVDTTSNTITSRLLLSSRPCDVTILPQNQAAVTLPYASKIQIHVVSTKGVLSAVRTEDVDGYCLGIASTMDRLVVSYTDPGKLEVMDFHGKVHSCVRADCAGSALFTNPRYVSVAEEGRVLVIYVSDYNTNSVTKLSLEGQVLATYTHKNWGGLRGLIATGDGQVLVCYTWNHTVDVVSEDGKKIQTLLDRSHGIEYPQSLCYCADNNTLYVCSNIRNAPVKVFQLNKK